MACNVRPDPAILGACATASSEHCPWRTACERVGTRLRTAPRCRVVTGPPPENARARESVLRTAVQMARHTCARGRLGAPSANRPTSVHPIVGTSRQDASAWRHVRNLAERQMADAHDLRCDDPVGAAARQPSGHHRGDRRRRGRGSEARIHCLDRVRQSPTEIPSERQNPRALSNASRAWTPAHRRKRSSGKVPTPSAMDSGWATVACGATM